MRISQKAFRRLRLAGRVYVLSPLPIWDGASAVEVRDRRRPIRARVKLVKKVEDKRELEEYLPESGHESVRGMLGVVHQRLPAYLYLVEAVEEEREENGSKWKMVSVRLPPRLYKLLKELVRRGFFPTIREAIRVSMEEVLVPLGKVHVSHLLDLSSFRYVGGAPAKTVGFKLPVALADGLDRLVESGLYMNRSQAIRHAIVKLLRETLWKSP